jgi:hypothetical protein
MNHHVEGPWVEATLQLPRLGHHFTVDGPTEYQLSVEPVPRQISVVDSPIRLAW